MPRKGRIYNLYTRCPVDREPRIATSVNAYDDNDRVIGNDTVFVARYGPRRGALVYTTDTYKDLVNKAESLAKVIGMPKSRIWDIFDWNQPS